MKIIYWLDDNLEKTLLIILSIIMVSVTTLQVFMRFVIGSSLGWSEELARYSFIWLIYIGISYGVKHQRHIKVDVALMLFNDRGKIILNIIANLFFLTFAIFVISYGYELSQNLLQSGRPTPSLNIPAGYVYLATPIGMGLTAIRLIQQIVSQIKTLLGHGEFEVKSEQDIILEEELNKP